MTTTKDLLTQPYILKSESDPEQEENKDNKPPKLWISKINKLDVL